MYQISHHNLDASLLDLFQPASTTCTRGLNTSSHVAKLAAVIISFPIERLITGIIYPPILVILIQSTLLKIF